MNAVYSQHYIPYYVPQGPRATHYGRDQKVPMYMMNQNYSGYGYLMYPPPPMVGLEMPPMPQANMYPAPEYTVPQQAESSKEKEESSSAKNSKRPVSKPTK